MNDWQYLDTQLEQLISSKSFNYSIFESTTFNRSKLASKLAEELLAFFESGNGYVSSLESELNNPISISRRRDALEGYFHLMDKGDIPDPVLQRSRIISQLYFDLIYFRDRIMLLLLKYIQAQKTEPKYPYLYEWLKIVGKNNIGNRVRALRNGFAHGKWEFTPDYSGIVCFPERNPPYTSYTFKQEELGIIHSFLYAFQIVFFTLLSNGS